MKVLARVVTLVYCILKLAISFSEKSSCSGNKKGVLKQKNLWKQCEMFAFQKIFLETDFIHCTENDLQQFFVKNSGGRDSLVEITRYAGMILQN